MKIMIGLRVSEKFKALLEEQAKIENRTLSNFIKNAIVHYIEEKGVRYIEADDRIETRKPKKQP
jgi:uncharacterized protein (DUF1778 family)